MQSKVVSKVWKIAGIYFLLYTLITVLISAVYSLIVVYGVSNLRLNVPPIIGNIDNILFPLVLVWVGIKISSLYVNRKFTIKNSVSTAKWATGYYITVDLLFLVRDLLITDINGIPIVRNYTLNIATSLISVAIFYYLTRKYLQDSKEKIRQIRDRN